MRFRRRSEFCESAGDVGLAIYRSSRASAMKPDCGSGDSGPTLLVRHALARATPPAVTGAGVRSAEEAKCLPWAQNGASETGRMIP